MKAYVRCGTLALLFAVACNRPDSDLFGADGSPRPPESGGGTSGTTPVAGSSSVDAGTGAGASADMTNSGGSTTPDMPSAGTPSTAGSAPQDQGGNGGKSNPPDPGGTAGVPDAAGGSSDPTQPTDPVCGNGILEAGEECDDAGHEGQDGCDATCKVVCSQHGPATLESEDHHCYAGYDQFDFTSAQQDCVKRGAHLATISSDAENKIARTLTNNGKWIGGYENVGPTVEGKGNYEWLTGEPFTYTNWAPQEPNSLATHCATGQNTRCYEHCIAILGDGTWADHVCDMSDGYVCEWDPAGSK